MKEIHASAAMEDLSQLLLEERSHSEQFKTNFVKLKNEYDKYAPVCLLRATPDLLKKNHYNF